MTNALDFLCSLIAALPALGFVLAVAMITPSWRWVISIMAMPGAVLAYFWFRHWEATLNPYYDEGPGGGIGVALGALITQSFAIAVAAYIAGVIWWHHRG